MSSGQEWPTLDAREPGTDGDADGSIESDRVLAHVMTGLFGPGAGKNAQIGRFTVLRRLGAGAMGEVFAAYDAELDRRVAIKLLRTQPDPEQLRLQQNLRREAQAIAKLAHPNVVPVFEVGEDAGRLFLVMELVEGMTLRAWLQAQPRKRHEILDMFAQVGEGLVAVHSATVVHRDLKPDNVLVGEDGRARLVDFGLARAEPSETTSEPGDRPSDASQTKGTGIVGTPRYMAPEQFRGDLIDHRADQFAFCVALYEALYGAAPFAGGSMYELAATVLSNERLPPPPDHSVPAAIGRVILRGLAPEPEQRFENMAALLVELRRARGVPRRRAVAGAVAVAVSITLGFVVWEQQQAIACRREAGTAADTWADARPSVEAAIVATALPYAEHTVERIGPALQPWTEDWAVAREASCLARGDDPNGMIARQDACLDDRLAEIGALLAVLQEADAEVVRRTADAVATLPPISGCTDPTRLALTPLPTPDQRATINALRPRLAAVDALFAAGRYADASAAATALLPEAQASGLPQTHAEVLRKLGLIESRMGRLDAAEARLQEAYFLGGRHGLDRTAALAASAMITLLGAHSQRIPEAATWVEHAQMMAARLDDLDTRLEVLHATGGLALERGDYDEGLEKLREAVALSTSIHGELHPGVGVDLIAIATGYSRAGDLPQARAELERAQDLIVRSLGEGHPLLADAIHNLANVATREGRYAEAAALHREALAIRERTLAPDHLDTAASLDGIGSALGLAGDAAGSREHFERAVAMMERLLGADHPRLAESLLNLGVALMIEGRTAEALARTEHACGLLEHAPGEERPVHASCQEKLGDALNVLGRRSESIAAYRKAVAIRERTAGPDHPETALAMHNLGIVLSDDGQHEEALTLLERADGRLVNALGEAHPYVLQTRLGLGEARLDAGNAAGARTLLEALLAAVERGDDNPVMTVKVRLALAEATWQAGEQAQARALAQAAHDTVRASADAGHADRQVAQRWLDEHRL